MKTENTSPETILANHFSEISNHAENLAFPDYRKRIFQPKDITSMKGISKFIYNLSHPFASSDVPGILFLIAWIIFYLVVYLAIILGLTVISTVLSNVSSGSASTVFGNWVIVIFYTIIGISISVVIYPWWFETLITKKYPWWVKGLLFISTIMLVGFLIRAIMMQNSSQVVLLTTNGILSIIYSFLLLLFPATSYFVAIIYDLLLTGLLVIITVFGGIKSIFEARPIEAIVKLVSDMIPKNHGSSEAWKLENLSKNEIMTIHKWAEANREGSEKRTIPAFLIAAIIGLFFSSETIQHLFDSLLGKLFNNVDIYLHSNSLFTLPLGVTFSAIVILPIISIFIVYLIKFLVAIFRNIVAQNLVIEACIVAEYKKEEMIRIQENEKGDIDLLGWLSKFMEIIRKIFLREL